MVALNRNWHERNRMPRNATADQRVKWHMAHAEKCGCRTVPASIARLIRQRTKPARTRVPFKLEGIDHVLLLIEDMPNALAFYQEVLGCRVVSRLPQYAMVQMRAGNALIDLVDTAKREGKWARPARRGGRNVDHLCIAISKYDERKLRSHLAAHSVAIVEEGIHGGARGDSLSIYVRDPSGNTIELKGPP